MLMTLVEKYYRLVGNTYCCRIFLHVPYRDKITEQTEGILYNNDTIIHQHGGKIMNQAVPKNNRKPRPKAVVDKSLCVACGCCVKVCPLSAIQIMKGVTARVDSTKCVGCGKCVRECPASVITLKEAAS